MQPITLEMLTDRKPLDDVRVRRAIAHAIDRKAMIDGLLPGLARDYCSPVTPAVGKEFVALQPCYEYSPQKAKDLLVQAGHPTGFEMEIWTSNGRYTKDREIGEATQAMLNVSGFAPACGRWNGRRYTKAWTAPDRMMWMIGRSTGFADFIFTRHFARASWVFGANNNTRFFDPRVEDLLVRARQEMDVKRRAAYYREIQELVGQASPSSRCTRPRSWSSPAPTSWGWSCSRTEEWAWRWSSDALDHPAAGPSSVRLAQRRRRWEVGVAFMPRPGGEHGEA